MSAVTKKGKLPHPVLITLALEVVSGTMSCTVSIFEEERKMLVEHNTLIFVIGFHSTC
jgi:hypothetical membrane protein